MEFLERLELTTEDAEPAEVEKIWLKAFLRALCGLSGEFKRLPEQIYRR